MRDIFQFPHLNKTWKTLSLAAKHHMFATIVLQNLWNKASSNQNGRAVFTMTEYVSTVFLEHLVEVSDTRKLDVLKTLLSLDKDSGH